jgi:hypothetical protein
MQSTVCGGFAGDTQPSVQVELVDPVSASGLASRIETSDTGRRSGFDAVKVRGAGSARGCTRLPLRRGSPAPRLTTFDAISARRCVSWKNLYRQPSATGPLIHLAEQGLMDGRLWRTAARWRRHFLKPSKDLKRGCRSWKRQGKRRPFVPDSGLWVRT